MHNDLVAILLATYNGEKYLTKQLDSIINQTYNNWIIYVHDDGSKDKTVDIINKYINKFPRKIKYIEGKPTGGAKDNFMYLMSKAKEDYIMFCDQDDVWLNNKIEVTLNEMKRVETKKETSILVFSDLKVVDKDLNVISDSLEKYQSLNYKKVDYASLLMQNQITGCTVMINKALLDKALVKDTKDIIMHDWWCALIAAKFGIISCINKQLTLYRQHTDNEEGAKRVNSLKYITNVLNDIKDSLNKTRKQSLLFNKEFKLPTSELSYRYGNVGKLNKLERMKFYKVNKMNKSGIARRIGLVVYG